jgi:hypothetical protein
MDIEDIKNLKRRSQLEILNILRIFEKTTGCSVYDVNIIVEKSLGNEDGSVVDVALRVQF